MSPKVTYPGVDVEEEGAGHTIDGVPTNVAAFIGYTASGPTNQPVRISSFAEFERQFGGIDASSETSYAVAQFFLNRGTDAWIVRVTGAVNDSRPSADELAGSDDRKTGLRALDDVDPVNILVLPGQSDAALQMAMIAYAEQRRAFALLDLPREVQSVADAEAWITANSALRHPNAAVYFPRVQAVDPGQGVQLRSFANSGAIAGVYARTDQRNGVWAAPAGMDATIHGVQSVDCAISETDEPHFNGLGLNALRSLPSAGIVIWGARTLMSADGLDSEWKYVPVRRMALFIEQSLERGLQWARFESGGERLWAEVRHSVGSFMETLFARGAFKGQTRGDAYVVNCNGTTNAGHSSDTVILEIGFAPLRPAEFLWLRIQIAAGQHQ